MRRMMAAVGVGLVVSVSALAGAYAQSPLIGHVRPAALGQESTDSRIVNVNEHTIQLDNGTVVRIPEGLVAQAALRAGRAVKVTWQAKGGENVAMAVEFLDKERGQGDGSR